MAEKGLEPRDDGGFVIRCAGCGKDIQICTCAAGPWRLADEHWRYLGKLLEYNYTQAFVHGYKHGVEDANAQKKTGV